MLKPLAAATLAAALASAPALAQDTKVAIGMSGWTGFAPLTLAKEAVIFKKNGLDVTLKMIPQKDRHLAIASGDVQCAATTVETWIVWNAGGVATKQIFQMDKSYGADGMAVRNNVQKIADLKGKTVAASAPGTAPYFTLAWFLKKNGLSVKDVTVVNLEPGPAAQAFVAGQNDAAMTYEPYLSAVRAKPEAGKIIATTLDYPTLSTVAYFSVGCASGGTLLKKNSDGSTTTGWAGWTSSKMTSIINAAHSAGTRVALTLSCFGWSTAGANLQARILNTASYRNTLAAQTAKAVHDRGADGVNLDFEPIASGQSANFVSFVHELRTALDGIYQGKM